MFAVSPSVKCVLKASLRHCDVQQPLSTFSRIASLWKDSGKPARPPYHHICQVGDPVLRYKAEEVHLDRIRTPEVQKVIQAMREVVKHYELVGLSAPQVRKMREMEACPVSVIINPTVKILDPHRVVFSEGCGSVCGLSASVPRHREVEVTGLDEAAQPVKLQAKGWVARIIQHETDHLDGRLLTDVMDPLTLQYDSWFTVNETNGRFMHPFR